MLASDTDKPEGPNSWGMDLLVVGSLAVIAILGITILSRVQTPKTPQISVVPSEAEIIESEILETPDLDNQIIDRPALESQIDERRDRQNDAVPVEEPLEYPAVPSGSGFITLMGDNLNSDLWYVSKHENKTGFYGADWRVENISVADQGTGISVRQPEDNQERPTAAEIKTQETYSYGTYEAMLRPARGSGIVTAFFTYTGPYFGNPHDEIDFEFLGADLTKVHLNYWRNGKTGKSKIIDLGFDAGDAAHLYSFNWEPDRLTWKVDGKVINTTEPGDAFIPRTPGNIYFSTWTGSKAMQAWHGPPTYESGTETDISCVSFVPMGADGVQSQGRSCSDFYPLRSETP